MEDFEKAPEGVDNFVLKICTGCGIGKPATAEYFYRRCKGLRLRADCKPCYDARVTAHRRKRLEEPGSESWLWERAGQRISKLKHRAEEQQVPFDETFLTREYMSELLATRTHCEFCGCKLVHTSGWKRSKQSFSVDKVFPWLGYVKNNLAIICNECNTIKQDITIPERFEQLAQGLRNKLQEIAIHNAAMLPA